MCLGKTDDIVLLDEASGYGVGGWCGLVSDAYHRALIIFINNQRTISDEYICIIRVRRTII